MKMFRITPGSVGIRRVTYEIFAATRIQKIYYLTLI